MNLSLPILKFYKHLLPVLFLTFFCNTNITAQVPNWNRVGYAPFSERDGVGSLEFNNKLWLIGGWDSYKSEPLLNEVWSSENGENWVLVNDSTPWEPRHSAGYVVFNNKMWLISGDGIDDVWYTEDGENWVNALNNAPWGKRYKPYVIVYKDKIWLIGGLDIENNYEPKNDVWVTVDGINWELINKGADWSPRGIIHGGVVFKDKLWIIGGGSYGSPPDIDKEQYYNDVWATKDGISWDNVANETPWLPRIHHSINVYADRMWVMAGHNYKEADLLADVWYSPDGVKWNKLENNGWWPRHAATVANFKGKMWMMLGFLHNDLWNIEIKGLTFLTSPLTQVKQGDEYYYASFADFQRKEDTVYYRLLEAPNWLNIDSLTGELRGIAPCEYKGDLEVKIEAYTENNESTIQHFFIKVIHNNNITVSYTADCSNNKIVIKSDSILDNYLWSTGDTLNEIEVSEPGKYQLYYLNNKGCTDSSNIITIDEKPLIKTKESPQLGDTLSTQYKENIVWYRDSVLVSYDSLYIVDQPGTYSAIYEGGICKVKSEPITISISSSLFDNHKVKVFPIPSDGYLTLELNDNINSEIKFEIISLQGHVVLTGSYSSNKKTIDINSLKNSMYFLRITYKNKQYLYKIAKI
jgi:hypothetical protein